MMIKKSAVTEELCKVHTHTFYSDVQDKMVYVTVTIHDIPHSIKLDKTSQRSIGDYMKVLAEVVDMLCEEDQEL